MTIYVQYELCQGDAVTVAWIEKRGAKVGASVELKTTDGKERYPGLRAELDEWKAKCWLNTSNYIAKFFQTRQPRWMRCKGLR